MARSLPLNPYATVPLDEWQRRLRAEPSTDERGRALQAVLSLSTSAARPEIARSQLSSSEAVLRLIAADWFRQAARSGEGSDTQRRDWAEWLLVLSDDPDDEVRFTGWLARVWLDPADEAAAESLLGLLPGDNLEPLAQASLLEALGRVPHQAVPCVALWPRFLAAESTEVREAAVAACRQFGPLAAPLVPRLIELLDDESPLVRELTAVALEAIGDGSAEVLSALTVAASDEDSLVAEAAAKAHRALHGEL